MQPLPITLTLLTGLAATNRISAGLTSPRKCVGHGGFGSVYVNEESKIAYKEIPTAKSDIASCHAEINRLKLLGLLVSVSVEKGKDFYSIPMKTLTGYGAIRCDLHQYIYEVINCRTNEDLMKKMFRQHINQLIPQWVDVMKYAHKHNIHHGDIKPENILVLFEPSGDIQTMICDWGNGTQYTEKYRSNSINFDRKQPLFFYKAQDVFAFYKMLWKNWIKIFTSHSISDICLWRSLLNDSKIKAIAHIEGNASQPNQFGCFQQLSTRLELIQKNINTRSCQSHDSALEESRKQLLNELADRYSKVVGKSTPTDEAIRIIEHYWQLRLENNNKKIKDLIDTIRISESNVEQFKLKQRVILNAINEYQKNRQSQKKFTLFNPHGDAGLRRADHYYRIFTKIKDMHEIDNAVKCIRSSYYLGPSKGSLIDFIDNALSNLRSENFVTKCLSK